MAVTAHWFGLTVKGVFNGGVVIDWDTDEFKCALVKSGFTPNYDTMDFFNDVTEELTTANGYTAGGVKLASPTVTYDEATNQTRLDAADAEWTASGAGITANKAVIYKVKGTSAESPLVCCIEFGADNTAAAGSKFVIVFDATGVAKVESP
jgi:hypothetical protein